MLAAGGRYLRHICRCRSGKRHFDGSTDSLSGEGADTGSQYLSADTANLGAASDRVRTETPLSGPSGEGKDLSQCGLGSFAGGNQGRGIRPEERAG